MQQPDRSHGRQRGLLGRFGNHAITGQQRRGNLADENRQRKIPRADANKHTAAAVTKPVVLAGRAGQDLRPAKQNQRVGGVIAAQIDGLAQFGQGIAQAAAALADA